MNVSAISGWAETIRGNSNNNKSRAFIKFVQKINFSQQKSRIRDQSSEISEKFIETGLSTLCRKGCQIFD